MGELVAGRARGGRLWVSWCRQSAGRAPMGELVQAERGEGAYG